MKVNWHYNHTTKIAMHIDYVGLSNMLESVGMKELPRREILEGAHGAIIATTLVHSSCAPRSASE